MDKRGDGWKDKALARRSSKSVDYDEEVGEEEVELAID